MQNAKYSGTGDGIEGGCRMLSDSTCRVLTVVEWGWGGCRMFCDSTCRVLSVVEQGDGVGEEVAECSVIVHAEC